MPYQFGPHSDESPESEDKSTQEYAKEVAQVLNLHPLIDQRSFGSHMVQHPVLGVYKIDQRAWNKKDHP